MDGPCRTRVSSLLLISSLILGGCSSEAARDEGSDLTISAPRMFDGTKMRTDVFIRIRDARIVEITPLAEVTEKADHVLADDQTLMPGLIDLHVHISFSDIEDLLRSGVTTVRDLGHGDVLTFPGNGDPGKMRLISAGPLLSAPKGIATKVWPTLTEVVRNRSEAKTSVSSLIDRGAGVVKVYLATRPRPLDPLIPARTLRAISDVAHRAGLIVTAHTSDERSTVRALDGNVDELAHSPCGELQESTLRQVVNRNVEIVGTLDVYEKCPGSMANARAFTRLGGTLLYGSDLGNPGIPHTLDVRELELMGRAGLDNAQILTAATKASAEQLGITDLGTVEVGSIADLIVVSGNPLTDIQAMADVILVMTGGKIVFADNPASADG